MAHATCLTSPIDWLRISRSLTVSAQQTAIIRLIVEDLDPTNDAIASALGISRRSVETQLQRIYTKLGVRSRAGMVARVFKEEVRLREEEIHRRGAEA